MCGICGFFNFTSETPGEIVRDMAASLRHRGNEASGFFVERPAAFGHQRLSIIDLASRADQPFVSANGRYVLVFNGEIYNYRELHGLIPDFSPRTTSDTEILAELWAHKGPDCLQYLNGMFAFAIFDRIEQSLFCVRDRLGVKPFYYWYDGHEFVFASEPKAILRHPRISVRLNLTAFSDYLSLGYVTGRATAFAGIEKLEPGHFIKVTSSGLSRVQYWNLARRIRDGSCRRSDDLADLLNSAVQYRLISDVPVGSFLSGGIDSSAITAMAARSNSELQTFTIGFREKSYDESAAAAEFAAGLKLENASTHFCEPDPAFLERIVEYFDQPFADTSVMPYFQLCSMAAQKMKVVLGGDGGDELFAGYETRRADALALTGFRSIPFWKSLLRIGLGMINLLPADRGKVSTHYKLRQFCEFAHLPPEKSHCAWRQLFSEDEKKLLLHPQMLDEAGHHKTFDTFAPMYASVRGLPMLQQQALVDLQSWLVDDILYKADQAAMAHTLEVRSPFLDYRIVEAAFAVPENEKFSLFQTKSLLRRSLTGTLPAPLLKKKKEGFGSPVSLWLEGSLADFFADCVHSESFRRLFPDTGRVMQLFDDHRNRVRDNGYRLWALLMFALWQKRWQSPVKK